MQSAVYKLALIVGLGNLALLLLRGYDMMEALLRSGIVLIVVMFAMIIASTVLGWTTQMKPGIPNPESQPLPTEPLESEPKKLETPEEQGDSENIGN